MKAVEILITEREKDIVLHPSGPLNHFVASDLRNDFEEIIKKHAKTTVLVDLTDVESVNAEAIGILVEEERRFKKRGISLKITGANSVVQHAFLRLGISDLLAG